MTWIAEDRVIWVFPSGERRAGRIAIASPEVIPERGEEAEHARCAYALDGLDGPSYVPGPVYGADAMQALVAALSLVGVRLHAFIARGGRVADPDDDGEEDLLGSTASLLSVYGPLLRTTGDSRGPADPKGEIAEVEAAYREAGRRMDEELGRDRGDC